MPKKRPAEKVCGANTSHGPCQQWKGSGTDHTGYENCKMHGGATRNHKVNVETQLVQERMATYGLPADISPKKALLDEVKRTAGHVTWLGEIVAKLESPDSEHPEYAVTQVTKAFGQDISGIVKLYQSERQHLTRVCAEALRHGVEQALVDLAKSEQEFFATQLRAIFSDPRIQLSEAQKAVIPVVAREHMSAALSVVA